MKKNNIKRKNLRPECGENAPTFLSAVYKKGTQVKKRQAGAPQYGRSMIEMLGVLAIIGVLSVGGIMGYSKAMMRYKINKTIEQITYIAGNIRTTFANQGNYGGLVCGSCPLNLPFTNCNYSLSGCNIVKKSKLIPEELLTITNGQITGISNAFDGVFVLRNTNNDKSFTITFDRIPTEACIELAAQDWQSSAYASAINVDGEDKYLLPISMEQAIDACSYTYWGDEHFISLAFDFKGCEDPDRDIAECNDW